MKASLIKTDCINQDAASMPAVRRSLDLVRCDLRFERNSLLEPRHRVTDRFDVLLSVATGC